MVSEHVPGWTWKHRGLDRLCPEISLDMVFKKGKTWTQVGMFPDDFMYVIQSNPNRRTRMRMTMTRKWRWSRTHQRHREGKAHVYLRSMLRPCWYVTEAAQKEEARSDGESPNCGAAGGSTFGGCMNNRRGISECELVEMGVPTTGKKRVRPAGEALLKSKVKVKHYNLVDTTRIFSYLGFTGSIWAHP
jgi:hypothetical protein